MQEWMAQIVRNAGPRVELNLKTVGFIIFCIGFAGFVENIIRPKNFHLLIKEYESAKAKGEKPSSDAEFCYQVDLFCKIGVVLMGTGGLVWIIGYLFKR